MMISDNPYKSHLIFEQLDDFISFYDGFSMSIFSFITMGTTAIGNIDSYVYSSMKGTLESIKMILVDGKINDAYALLRKLHDLAIINIYTNLYLDDNHSIDNFMVDKINSWLHGKEQLPEYRVMSTYIRKSQKLQLINELLYSNDAYKNIRNRCNNHTHYNFFENVLINDNQIYSKERIKLLNSFSNDLNNLVILHLSSIFYLNDHYMMSGDYIDSLDCGMTPEPDSQYWVATFIQKMLTEVVASNRPDIYNKIKEKTQMHLN